MITWFTDIDKKTEINNSHKIKKFIENPIKLKTLRNNKIFTSKLLINYFNLFLINYLINFTLMILKISQQWELFIIIYSIK